MGLSIHYQGNIKDYALIGALTAETEDICASLNWPCQVFDPAISAIEPGEATEKFTPDDLNGISFTPEECETVFLTFLPNGALCSPLKLMFYDPSSNDMMIEVVHTKTQYAGPDTHIAILKLLDYLSKKYFASFELNDEGGYWGTWDKGVLLAQFTRYNFIVDQMRNALADVKLAPGESIDALADRIEEIIRKKFGGEETS